MFGSAQANALSTVVHGDIGVGTVVGVGAHPEATHVVGPTQQGRQARRGFRRLDAHGTDVGDSRRTIDGDRLAGRHSDVGRDKCAVDHAKAAGATDSGAAHAACDDGRVGSRATIDGEDAAGGHHARQVARRCLRHHEDHRVAVFGH